jgi:hypothetical protein
MGLANSDHTTLLLNTYTKLKDVARLDSFIKTESKRSDLAIAGGEGDHSGKLPELPFDLDTAIRVCRQAGYFDHASYLAKRYERHEDYLRIQIEDAGNYKLALAYLRRLGPETVCFSFQLPLQGVDGSVSQGRDKPCEIWAGDACESPPGDHRASHRHLHQ